MERKVRQGRVVQLLDELAWFMIYDEDDAYIQKEVDREKFINSALQWQEQMTEPTFQKELDEVLEINNNMYKNFTKEQIMIGVKKMIKTAFLEDNAKREEARKSAVADALQDDEIYSVLICDGQCVCAGTVPIDYSKIKKKPIARK